MNSVKFKPQTETDQILQGMVPWNSEVVDVSRAQRKSGRVSRISDRYFGNIGHNGDLVLLILESDEPKTYKVVVFRSSSMLWIDFIQSEMDSMYDNQV